MENIIEVKGLKKAFAGSEVVKGIDFNVGKGELFAFLGTNGAGKSTTINMLTTLLKKTDGTVLINGFELGKDDLKIKESIGVVFQNSVLDDLLTVKENLDFKGSLYSLNKVDLKKRISNAIEITECGNFLNKKYGKLSGGQRRRVDIASALINKPKVLFLDEPTTGLDPSTRLSIWNNISYMQKDLGMTVFLTTHYMEEAAKADNICIINKGKIIEKGTPISLKEKYTFDILKIYFPNEKIINFLNLNKIKHNFENDKIIIKINSYNETIELLNSIKNEVKSFEVIKGDMDDVFINITENYKN